VRQLTQTKETIRGDASDSLYTHHAGVLSLLQSKPHLYPYFYESKVRSADDDARHPNLEAELKLAAESILALIEHAIVFKEEVDEASWTSCWLPYAKVRFALSPALKAFYDENWRWFAEDMRKELKTAGIVPPTEEGT
jgi:hypothetical protein